MFPTPQPSLFFLNPIIFVQLYPKKAKFHTPHPRYWFGGNDEHTFQCPICVCASLAFASLPYPSTRLKSNKGSNCIWNWFCRVIICPQPREVQYQHPRQWQLPLWPKGEKDERSEHARQGNKLLCLCTSSCPALMDRNVGRWLHSLIHSTNVNEHFLFAGTMPGAGIQDEHYTSGFVLLKWL